MVCHWFLSRVWDKSNCVFVFVKLCVSMCFVSCERQLFPQFSKIVTHFFYNFAQLFLYCINCIIDLVYSVILHICVKLHIYVQNISFHFWYDPQNSITLCCIESLCSCKFSKLSISILCKLVPMQNHVFKPKIDYLYSTSPIMYMAIGVLLVSIK